MLKTWTDTFNLKCLKIKTSSLMCGWGGGKQGGFSLKGGQILKQTYRDRKGGGRGKNRSMGLTDTGFSI